MNKQYKGQFESWQPGYPAIFHGSNFEVTELLFSIDARHNATTMKTHNITINAIKKGWRI